MKWNDLTTCIFVVSFAANAYANSTLQSNQVPQQQNTVRVAQSEQFTITDQGGNLKIVTPANKNNASSSPQILPMPQPQMKQAPMQQQQPVQQQQMQHPPMQQPGTQQQFMQTAPVVQQPPQSTQPVAIMPQAPQPAAQSVQPPAQLVQPSAQPPAQPSAQPAAQPPAQPSAQPAAPAPAQPAAQPEQPVEQSPAPAPATEQDTPHPLEPWKTLIPSEDAGNGAHSTQ